MPKQFIGAGMGGSLLMVDNTISTYDRGGVGNHIHKFGYNPDVDVFSGGSEDIIAHGGLQWFPSAVVAAADIRVYSSSANDTSNGTHARTITIVGLNANYHEQTEVVTLAGTVVAHPLNDYIRIDRAYISTSGTAYTNAGNITIDNTANIFVQINTGLGQSPRRSTQPRVPPRPVAACTSRSGPPARPAQRCRAPARSGGHCETWR